MGRSTEQEHLVERDQEVPEVHRAAEDRDRARVAARPKTITQLCREHDIADSLLRKWREQFLAAGAERLQGRQERTEADELRRQIARLEPPSPRPTALDRTASAQIRSCESRSLPVGRSAARKQQ